MANNYTEFCIALPCTKEEADRLESLRLLYYQTVAREYNTPEAYAAVETGAQDQINRLLVEYPPETLTDGDYAECWLGVLLDDTEITYENMPETCVHEGVLYVMDDAGDVSPDCVGLWLRTYLQFFEKDQTITFTYSNRSDSHRPDEFGGGFGIVTRDGYQIYDLAWIVRKMLADKMGILSLLLGEETLPVAVSDDGSTILFQPTKASIRYARNKTSIELLPRDQSGSTRSQKMIVLE